MAFFSSLGQLNDWAAAAGVEVVDAGQPLLSYDPRSPEKKFGVAPVHTVVDFIARHIASLPLKAYRREEDGDGRVRVRDSRLAGLVAEPWDSLPAFRFWYALIADGLLSDRMLAVVELKGGRSVLRRIPPRHWQVLSGPMDSITGARIFSGDGQPVDVRVGETEMVLDVGYASSGVKGTPRAEILERVLAEFDASLDYRSQVNARTARAPFAVLRDRDWPSAAARERFERGMRDFVAGRDSAGSGLLVEDGMKIEALNMFKPIDVQDLTARDKVKIDVAVAYGIPPEIVGFREGNFSNLEAFRQMLFGTYLRPYITAFEQALNAGLRHLAEPGEYIEFDLDAQLRGNPEAQYSAMSTATGRPFMTTNEIRARMNLPPVEGGDDLVTPLNVTLGGQTSPQDGVTAGRGGGSADVEDEEEPWRQ